MSESSFRGYRSIEEIVKKLRPLADWIIEFKPDQKRLTLKRTELDLIRRWPKASKLLGIHVGEGGGTAFLQRIIFRSIPGLRPWSIHSQRKTRAGGDSMIAAVCNFFMPEASAYIIAPTKCVSAAFRSDCAASTPPVHNPAHSESKWGLLGNQPGGVI